MKWVLIKEIKMGCGIQKSIKKIEARMPIIVIKPLDYYLPKDKKSHIRTGLLYTVPEDLSELEVSIMSLCSS